MGKKCACNNSKHEAPDLITWGAIIFTGLGVCSEGRPNIFSGVQNFFAPLTIIDKNGGFVSPKDGALTFFSIRPYVVQKLLTSCHK